MATETVLELTEDNFQAEVLDADQPVLVDFWSDGCMPCKMLSPVIEKIAEAYQGRVKVGKLNAGEHMAIAVKYQIASVPTVLLINQGEVTQTLGGLQPEAVYTAALDKLLG